ncbi:MAG: S8 family serine peptidase [Saprospiraceae bacterium]
MRQLITLLLLAPLATFAQSPNWESKIDPKLREYASNPDSAVEFLVIMQEQADLSAAKQLKKKEEKGRYVFQTLAGLSQQTQRNIRDMLHVEAESFQSFWIINALWVKGNKTLIEKVAKMPEVGRLEINPVWHLQEPKDGFTSNLAEDRLTPDSWGLTKINADDVWNMGFTGAGVVVGGQDTGYEWEHPAIKEKYRGWDGTTADHNYNWHDAIRSLIGAGGNSCGLDLSEPCDDHNHGTHTVGTMTGGEDADHIIGVAPDAKWMGCRNMEEGDGEPSTYIECFEWFVAPTDLNDDNPDPAMAPHVINNSWGCPTSEGCNSSNFATMEDVVNNVRAAGIVIVVSAGNSGSGCETVDSPAAIYDGVYSVGATNSSDVITGFSSRGPVTVYTQIMKPDISAPGANIKSCIGHDNDPGSYNYANWNGTSMAGPHVAGAVALIFSARPDLIGDVDAIENVINNTAVAKFATAPFCGNDNGSSLPNNVYGHGRLDVLAAVNAALPIELLDFNVKANGRSALLSWTTASEIDCSHFTLQRSLNGINWQNIGEVSCKGTPTAGETAYTFSDDNPFQGVNYYRFEQMDYSGKIFYSPIRILTMSQTGYTLRMSSGDGKAYYQVIGENAGKETWHLQICAIDGRVLIDRAVGAKGWLEAPELPAGVYLAVLHHPNGSLVATEKFIW